MVYAAFPSLSLGLGDWRLVMFQLSGFRFVPKSMSVTHIKKLGLKDRV